VDETILSQCNSFLILRLVNPRDQSYVKQIMENLSEQDARMLPGFGPGQGIISGQAVRFPLLVKIRMDEDLKYTGLGDENFLAQARDWKPDPHAPVRERVASRLQALEALPDRRPKGRESGAKASRGNEEAVSADADGKSDLSQEERWENVRTSFLKDERAMGELEAATGLEWVKTRRRDKVAVFASKSWGKLKALRVSSKQRESLLEMLESAAK
jgi:hypothetical protein